MVPKGSKRLKKKNMGQKKGIAKNYIFGGKIIVQKKKFFWWKGENSKVLNSKKKL